MSTTLTPLIPEDLRAETDLHIDRIRKQMTKEKLDAVLVASNANILYTTQRFFRGYVFITPDKPALRFVVRPNDVEGENVVFIRKPEQIIDELGRLGYAIPRRLGLEYDSLTYSEVDRLRKALPESETANASEPLRLARMVKTEYEIGQIKKDAIHQMECYRRVPHCWKEDMSDVELQVEIERVLRLEGALGFTRVNGALMDINTGSLLAGSNADVPTPYDFAMGGAGSSPALPVGADGSIIHPGETIMVDMSGAFNVYQSDMTRCWRVGDVAPLATKAHECSRTILRVLEKMALPGVKVSELYHRAMAIVEEQRLEDYFMGHTQKVAFIGHGVGIELNERPVIMGRSRDVLEEGMILAIEPKFVIPGVGAVGVENTYAVRRDGLENLTPFPEELADI